MLVTVTYRYLLPVIEWPVKLYVRFFLLFLNVLSQNKKKTWLFTLLSCCTRFLEHSVMGITPTSSWAVGAMPDNYRYIQYLDRMIPMILTVSVCLSQPISLYGSSCHLQTDAGAATVPMATDWHFSPLSRGLKDCEKSIRNFAISPLDPPIFCVQTSAVGSRIRCRHRVTNEVNLTWFQWTQAYCLDIRFNEKLHA